MILGIILAAGKGKRFKSKKVNKTASVFRGKPVLEYALELFQNTCDKTVVVVGAYSESLKEIIKKYPNAVSVFQKKRLGTGHAVKVAISAAVENGWSFSEAYVGYGDHMMFYTKKDLKDLISELKRKKAAVSLFTCDHDPETLAWGRIIRDAKGDVDAIVEEKVASKEQKKIRELNPGFYCLDFDFLKEGVFKIKKTEGGECYFTDIVAVAKRMNRKVVAVKVPFEHVGIGINTKEELEKSENLYSKVKKELTSLSSN